MQQYLGGKGTKELTVPRVLLWPTFFTPTEDTGVSAAEVVFGAPLVLPGQILDTGEPPPADFIAKLRQSGPPPPSRPLSYAQMAAKRGGDPPGWDNPPLLQHAGPPARGHEEIDHG